jgi:hypothetical protein
VYRNIYAKRGSCELFDRYLGPTDVMVHEWVGEKHACVDLTEVSPLVGLRSETFIVGQAAVKPCFK